MNFESPDPKFTDEFFKLVERAKSVVITSHTSLDDDAIGSCMTIYQILKEKYLSKTIDMIISGQRLTRYDSFKFYKNVIFVKDFSEVIEKYDCLILLDGGQYARFTKFPEVISKYPHPTICIDHHKSPPDKFTLLHQDDKATSTCELIYKLVAQDSTFTKDLCESTLLGILGDTDTFNFIKSNQLDVFSTCRFLIEKGNINIQDFKSRYDVIHPHVFEIIRSLVNNLSFKSITGWPDFVYSQLSRNYFESNNFTDDEISEASHLFMIHYLVKIQGFSWGLVVTPKSDNSYSMSLRSLPSSINVREIVGKMGVGGGHDRAAGSTLTNTPNAEDCLNKVFSWLESNQPGNC